jgi:4-hydroxy-tetrahydrodipicolinate synthase
VGDADLRLYFYHFPQLTGVPIPFPVIERLRATYPEQIAGVKDSSGEWDHTQALCRDVPDLQVFAGTERLLLPVLRSGGAGCISATANVTAPLAGRVYRQWAGGGDAEALDDLQDTLSDLRTRLAAFPMIAALKTLMAWRHGHDPWTLTRPPLSPFPDDEVEPLRKVNIALNRALE